MATLCSVRAKRWASGETQYEHSVFSANEVLQAFGAEFELDSPIEMLDAVRVINFLVPIRIAAVNSDATCASHMARVAPDWQLASPSHLRICR